MHDINNKTKTIRIDTRALTLCAFMTALIAICSWLAIPQPFSPIPVNLALLAVMLSGTVLGVRRGLVAVLCYIIMGAIGLPVFASFKSTAALIGPTGGYIIGYIPAVVIAAALGRSKKPVVALTGLTLSVASCYLLGTLWYTIYADIDFVKALMACVVPFIMGDVFKLIAVYALTQRLRSIKSLDLRT